MSRVRLVALGTAQDGGLPQAGCDCRSCQRARSEPQFARRVACLGLWDEKHDSRYMIDCTPDLPRQLDHLKCLTGRPKGHSLDGILLTHAHAGHYAGLVNFGREMMNSAGIPVWCTPDMGEMLSTNAPWNLLLRLGNIVPVSVAPGSPVAFGGHLTLTPVTVPHRNEITGTIGLFIRGPERTALYIPDADSWAGLERSIVTLVADAGLAILDGTFFAESDLAGRRSMVEIPHPPMTRTMDLLQSLVDNGKKVYFSHMNHTNPALCEESPERLILEERGFSLLEEGQVFEL